MTKRTTFTSITPLPAGVTRQTALTFLHDHAEMIDLNPLVIERHTIQPPRHAGPEEQTCTWYTITDKISYLPGTNLVSGNVSYTCAFHDLPQGLQTHCYAGLGLEIRDLWSVGGSEMGEEPEVQELGIGAPASGLYIREDVDFKCNVLMAGFVKKTLKKAHSTLVEAMARKAQAVDPEGFAQRPRQDGGTGNSGEAQRASSTGDEEPFVSSGGNQGQPGQGGYVRRYEPPRLPQGQGEYPRDEHHGSGEPVVLAEMDGESYVKPEQSQQRAQ